MLITFEGLDGSGKTTQARLLVEKLKSLDEKREVHFIREPGGTIISEQIREILLNRKHLNLGSAGELLLFAASRSQLVLERIAPALKREEHVVCDRYYDSTTAYQGYGRGIDLGMISAINRLATLDIVPAITVLIDIPVGQIKYRKESAGEEHDRMESAGKEFYERVRNGYLEIARQEQERFVVVDGTGKIDEIHDKVMIQVLERIRSGKQTEKSIQ